MKRFFYFLLLMLSMSSVSLPAQDFLVVPATSTDLQMVREGGFVLFIRHGPTDSSRPDHVPIDLNDCNTQRPLTEQGKVLMSGVAEAIQLAGFPLGNIYTSPLCRAVETTEILFGTDTFTVEKYLMYVAALTSNEKIPIIAKTQALLSEDVSLGENRILVAHGPNLVEVMDYFPVEGALVIFKPLGDEGGFEYIATIEPDHWAELLPNLE
ncbi:histidine phosphatase family protein [Nitrincola schmidtii]|uniref:histidine phosphatase family protein n=1 Tax=Nitrincola schmidtii TaxID=1730894 RepID=UPI00124C10FF|nr:histidine phosphatase family protein [Nitrincola schmidtii]